MFLYRFIYFGVLFASVAFYAAYSPWFSWYLLVLVLLLLPLDLLLSLPGMFSKTARISAPHFLEKDEDGALTVTVINKKRFPVRCLVVRLRVTGDDFAARCRVVIPAGGACCGGVAIDTSQTGLTVFEIERLHTISLMGLFSLRVRAAGRARVLILPLPGRPDNSLELPRGLALKPKPGGGFSEEHDMREYLPGDPVKSIHWKLSAKYDSLIIREPLIPVQQSRLVHIIPWENAEERDSRLSHLRWAAGYLTDRELTFFVKFGDRPLVEEVAEEADLFDFLRRVLDNSTVSVSINYPRLTRFSWVYRIE